MAKELKKTSTAPEEQITVNPNSVIGSQYAQIINFSVSDVDATFEFVYVNPQLKTGFSTARITVPRATADQMPEVITETLKKHEENKKRA